MFPGSSERGDKGRISFVVMCAFFPFILQTTNLPEYFFQSKNYKKAFLIIVRPSKGSFFYFPCNFSNKRENGNIYETTVICYFCCNQYQIIVETRYFH